jgi:7-carboxy-7-deazaguanine synthase
MSYKVKELFYTLQGEGSQVGRAAVFCRFTGCNLWSGREKNRHKAICQFCDTDFVGIDGIGGGYFVDATHLADSIQHTWIQGMIDQRKFLELDDASDLGTDSISVKPFVVCTGGEPLLQLDQALVDALHKVGFEVGIESNGTCLAPKGIDHMCISPKAGAPLKLLHGHELKLVYPQAEAMPHLFADLDFEYFYLQPMDGPSRIINTQKAIAYCQAYPQWRLSIQTHKVIGIP